MLSHYCAARSRYKCPVEVKIVVDFEPFHCVVLKSGNHDHSIDNHATAEGKRKSKSGSWGIAHHLRPFITELVVQGKLPKEILRALQDGKLEPKPTIQQLRNFAAKVHRNVTSDLPSDNIGSFIKWVRDHQLTESTSDEEVFVLPDPILPETVACEDLIQSKLRLVCVLSTRKLLHNAVQQQDNFWCYFVCIDGTFNLLANSWPTLIIGTVDLRHSFRLIGIAISSNEDAPSFKAALQSLSAGIAICFPGRHLQADYTMQDGAEAIYNATQQVRKPKTVLSCWFHVKQAVKKRQHEFSGDNFARFYEDLDALQVSTTSSISEHRIRMYRVFTIVCFLQGITDQG